MGGVNPATKQTEAAKREQEEETVDELLEKYEEVKDKTNVSLSPHDVKDHLPPKAFMRDGKLYVPSHGSRKEDTTLTPLRKKILRAFDEGLTIREIKERGISSDSYASRTKQEFGFILENPALRSAFIDKGRVPDNWRLVDPRSGTKLTFETREDAFKNFERVCNTFGVPEVYHRGEKVEPESEFDFDSDDDNNESQPEPAEIETFTEGIENPLDKEDWQTIIAALHRDDKDDLAAFLMDRFL